MRPRLYEYPFCLVCLWCWGKGRGDGNFCLFTLWMFNKQKCATRVLGVGIGTEEVSHLQITSGDKFSLGQHVLGGRMTRSSRTSSRTVVLKE